MQNDPPARSRNSRAEVLKSSVPGSSTVKYKSGRRNFSTLFDSTNHMRAPLQPLPQRRHGFGQPALLGAHPQGPRRTRQQKAGSVRLSSAIFLFGNRPAMIGGRAVARRSIGRANSVAVLRNLHRGPIVLPQRGNQSRDHAGFPHASRMPANHHNRTSTSFSPISPAPPTVSDTA